LLLKVVAVLAVTRSEILMLAQVYSIFSNDSENLI